MDIRINSIHSKKILFMGTKTTDMLDMETHKPIVTIGGADTNPKEDAKIAEKDIFSLSKEEVESGTFVKNTIRSRYGVTSTENKVVVNIDKGTYPKIKIEADMDKTYFSVTKFFKPNETEQGLQKSEKWMVTNFFGDSQNLINRVVDFLSKREPSEVAVKPTKKGVLSFLRGKLKAIRK